MKRFIFIFALLAIMIPAVIFAAKPARGTIEIDPVQPAISEIFTIEGTDFVKNSVVFITFNGRESIAGSTDKKGAFVETHSWDVAEPLTIRVYERQKSGRWRYVTQNTICIGVIECIR